MMKYSFEKSLTFDTVPQIMAKVAPLLQANSTIDFDLTSVAHIDSAGVAFLLELIRLSQALNHSICFKHCPANLVRLEKIYQLEPVLANYIKSTHASRATVA
ncbi:MAG: STAS domain-containing protein [Pseudomonadota bacterium]